MAQSKKYPYLSRSSAFPVGTVALFAFRWEAHLIKEWGYAPLSTKGLAVGFGLWLSIVLVAVFADFGLYRAGLSKSARSGIWLAALLGPYAGMTALHEWGHLVGSQMIGVAVTLLAFLIGYWLEQRAAHKNIRVPSEI